MRSPGRNGNNRTLNARWHMPEIYCPIKVEGRVYSLTPRCKIRFNANKRLFKTERTFVERFSAAIIFEKLRNLLSLCSLTLGGHFDLPVAFEAVWGQNNNNVPWKSCLSLSKLKGLREMPSESHTIEQVCMVWATWIAAWHAGLNSA